MTRAELIGRQVLTMHNPHACAVVVEELIRLRDPEEAERVARQSVEKWPRSSHPFYALYDALWAQGKKDEAEIALAQALEEDPHTSHIISLVEKNYQGGKNFLAKCRARRFVERFYPTLTGFNEVWNQGLQGVLGTNDLEHICWAFMAAHGRICEGNGTYRDEVKGQLEALNAHSEIVENLMLYSGE